jgi:hypothetical protein
MTFTPLHAVKNRHAIDSHHPIENRHANESRESIGKRDAIKYRRTIEFSILASLLIVFIAFAGARLTAGARVAASGLAQQHKAKSKSAKPVAPTKEMPVPFGVGETLNYRVSWAGFTSAATLQLSIPERRNLYGWATWHFRAAAHTLNPVRRLFAVDDQFDSYTDAFTFESRQLELHLNELGKSSDEALHLTIAGQVGRTPGPSTIVAAGTRDGLGAIYYLRSVDWKKTPEIHCPLYDGQNLYDADAKLVSAAEPLTTGLGKFSTSHVTVKLFQNQKEMTTIHLQFWLDNAGSHAPLVIEADLPFGSLRAELLPGPR